MQYLFSIIIPVYNVEKYINRCLDSIVTQKFQSYEIILVDDGSTDNSAHICDEYARDFNNIKVIHTDNGGPSKARNLGIDIATGEYITFTDSDDFWYGSDVLAHVQELIIRNSKPDIIFSDIIKYYTSTDTYIFPQPKSSEIYNDKGKVDILKYLYYEHADLKMSACQKFVKSHIAKEIRFTNGLFSEDIEWSLRIYPFANSFCLNSNPYYCYRQLRPGSRSTTPPVESFNSVIYILERHSDRFRKSTFNKDERNIYLGYLAYQLCMGIYLINTLPIDIKKDGVKSLSNFKFLFEYPTNYKTRKLKLLVSLIGIKKAAYLIKKFISLRAKWHQRRSR